MDKIQAWVNTPCLMLVEDIHQNAVEHGWWEGRSLSDKSNLDAIYALIHSELSEALEEYRNNKPAEYHEQGKPEGWAVEFGDAVIRILDYFGRKKSNEYVRCIAIPAFHKAASYDWGTRTGLPELIAKMHWAVSRSWSNLRKSSDCFDIPEAEADIWLLYVVKLAIDYCEMNGCDLNEIIKEKHEYNKTRPFRHGGKVI